jgi:hypothetical protein
MLRERSVGCVASIQAFLVEVEASQKRACGCIGLLYKALYASQRVSKGSSRGSFSL